MAEHLYLGVTCKTPNCGNVGALKYFGPDIGQIEIQEMTPTGADYECGKCHLEYHYEVEDMYVYRTTFAPPPGWKSGW